MSHTAASSVPRAPLIALGAMLVAALLAAGAVRLTGIGATHAPEAASVLVRELNFEDRPDGSIAIVEAGRQIDSVAPGSNGFLRGTMRGLARERKRQGLTPDLPFRLIGHADGRLTLLDPGTGREIDLGSFGPTNAAVFSRLLAHRQNDPQNDRQDPR